MQEKKYIDIIIDRLKSYMHVKTDSAVAKLLGLEPSNFCRDKKKGYIPYEKIINYCIKHKILINKIFEIKTSEESYRTLHGSRHGTIRPSMPKGSGKD